MLEDCYEPAPNGFYKCRKLDKEKRELLKKKFKKLGFTALNFTDSRSTFQFYSLEIFKNELKGVPAKYDFRTTYASKFGGKDGYIYDKEAVLKDVKMFVEHMIKEGEQR